MINLGPYSGKNCPNVRFQPTVIDRILEVGDSSDCYVAFGYLAAKVDKTNRAKA